MNVNRSLFCALTRVDCHRFRLFRARAASLVTKFPSMEVFIRIPKMISTSSGSKTYEKLRVCCISQVCFNPSYSQSGSDLPSYAVTLSISCILWIYIYLTAWSEYVLAVKGIFNKRHFAKRAIKIDENTSPRGKMCAFIEIDSRCETIGARSKFIMRDVNERNSTDTEWRKSFSQTLSSMTRAWVRVWEWVANSVPRSYKISGKFGKRLKPRLHNCIRHVNLCDFCFDFSFNLCRKIAVI